ncbi:hypothetical protein [Ornithinimicrobium cerasi]|uniref:hypothetical protein n=1 Tax=Ornithinimicrobium cerasi TaxID=2248773 RepID=UPI000EFEF171|nr:hypothetical protein [Ornithinimicrobium cerasi]
MNESEPVEALDQMIWDMEHGHTEDFGQITGTVVGSTPIVTMQGHEIFAYDMPIFGYWSDCE